MERQDHTEPIEPVESPLDQLRDFMCDYIADLGKQATLTLADLYETERMGIEFSERGKVAIVAERNRLLQSAGQASALWQQLEATMIEVERSIGSLQFMIDPENN